MNYIASWAGADNPVGPILNKMRLSLLLPFAVSFRKTVSNSDFLKDFFMNLYMMGQGQLTPVG